MAKTNNQSLPTADIIGRLMEALGATTQAELGERLGVAQGTVANWKNRHTMDYPRVLAACQARGYSLHWVLTGEGPRMADAIRDPRRVTIYSRRGDVLVSVLEDALGRIEYE
jgi:transcriptional regulator with XRE-family HTH domain